MHTHGNTYGVNTATGKPYVRGCRGTITFESVDDALAFMSTRSRRFLAADVETWDAFESDVKSFNGVLGPDYGDSDF